MTNAQHRFRIVVALDRSEYAEIVVEHAIDQAARHDAPDLHFLTVAEAGSEVAETKRWLAEQVLPNLDSLGPHAPDWRSRLHVVCGKAAEEISSFSADLRADLIVIGHFGVHQRKGSVADLVIERATCPTLVVGLTERSFDGPAQCARCVEIREQSDGERWFCDAHADGERSHFTALLPSTTLTQGSLLW